MSRGPRTAELTIRFTSWWRAGTDRSGPGDINRAVYRDDTRCPALPMTQVKGTLRETAERFALLDDARLLAFFGKRANEAGSAGGDALVRFAGDARLAPAEIEFFRCNADARAQLFSSIGSASIHTHGGNRGPSTGRRIEVAVPATLRAFVQWVGEDPPDDWAERLDEICAFTPAFGSMKNDGYGRAIASCAAEAERKPRAAKPSAKLLPPADGAAAGRSMVLTLRPTYSFVFSRTAATQGTHETLPAPTGAALLGWAAEHLYRSFAAQGIAETVFHSGRVRFSNAVRVVDAEPVFSSPAILMAPKNADGLPELGPAAFDAVFNADRDRAEVQSHSFKPVPVTLTGAAVRPSHRHYRQRTAVNSLGDGLFGHEYVIAAGATFRAVIECDCGAVNDAQWAELLGQFEGRTLYLGRGRWTGYGGGFTCSLGAETPWPGVEGPLPLERIRMWLLSDAAVLDDHGNPRLALDARDFALEDGWRLNRPESAARTFRVWPWNSHLASRDLELGVIAMGSVFTFDWFGEGLPQKAPAPVIGSFRERGLGRVAIIPAGFRYVPAADRAPERKDAREPETAASSVVRWASQAAKAADTANLDHWVATMSRAVDAHVRATAGDGPSISQWSQVARAARGEIPLERALRASDWGVLVLHSEVPTLGDWVRTALFEGNPFVEEAERARSIARVVRSARQTLGALQS